MNIDHAFYFIFILNCFGKVKIKLAFDTKKKKKLIPFLTIQSLERGFSDPTSPNIFELHLLPLSSARKPVNLLLCHPFLYNTLPNAATANSH